jgi:hypothetical protein
MAISTDSLIDFFGTQDSVDDGSTSSIADAAFSVAADITAWTNDDDAPACVMVLKCQFATAPTDGTVINVHGRKMDVDGTNDSPVPDAANLDQIIGNFTVDGTVATATDAYLTTNWMPLHNHKTSQQYEFYLENKTGQTISANWTLKITPCTKGPHA